MKTIKCLGLCAGLLVKAVMPYFWYCLAVLVVLYIAYPQLFDMTWIKELLK